MNLAEKLKSISAAGSKQIPEDKIKIMGRSTENLRASGILSNAIKVGDRLPNFNLPNQNGDNVQSSDLLDRGPLVLTVFRGNW